MATNFVARDDDNLAYPTLFVLAHYNGWEYRNVIITLISTMIPLSRMNIS